jgi:hypothetical protein
MTSTAARRSRVAAQKQTAKQKRQVYLVAGLCVLLVVMLGLELPKILKSSSPPAAAPAAAPAVVPTAVAPAETAKSSAALRAALKSAPRDVFVPTTSGSPTTLGSVATPPGLHDPFASPTTSDAAVAPVVSAPPKAPQLPGKIVLGTPGAGKVAVSGWIVILASIPTAAGQSSATSFASQAEKAGIGPISILNSSNRRPLRGGFWVVYTGPYSSLIQVSSAADNVHKSGFSSAYIRELIVYKAKPAAKHKTKKK